jgi:6-phosphogluconate dehydrogenase
MEVIMVKNIEFGIIGLGKMGGNLARQALEKKIRVSGYTLGDIDADLVKSGIVVARSIDDFRNNLSSPRIIFLYVPSGPAVDELLEKLAGTLDKGDIIVDGGNSYWGDSIRRFRKLKEKGLNFIDLGTSGGVDGARNGACFMAGGEKDAVSKVEPILFKLAVEGGYLHAGGPGTGHFTKLVHNGIEFGMLEAIGEGISLLKRYHEQLNIPDLLHCWRNGSVIRSWLVDLMEKQYRETGGLDKVPSYIDDTGEVNWLIADSLRMEVPIPAISLSVMQLFASRDSEKTWAKSIAMMRHGFGGHPFGGPNKGIVKERREGRVGEIFVPESERRNK